MINIFRYFIVTIALFGRRKQIKPNGDKTVTIRSPQCKQGKSFLKSMFYMIIDTRKQFYRFYFDSALLRNHPEPVLLPVPVW